MVSRSTADKVGTRRILTLRPRGSKILLVGVALQVFGQLLILVAKLTAGDLSHLEVPWVIGLVSVAYLVTWSGMWWFLTWVRVQPSGLVIRYWFTRRAVGWDEIDTVRLTTKRARFWGSFYGPMLELRSGEELLIPGLFSLCTTRRLPSSVPARHVEIIASYLRDHRPQQREKPEGSC